MVSWELVGWGKGLRRHAAGVAQRGKGSCACLAEMHARLSCAHTHSGTASTTQATSRVSPNSTPSLQPTPARPLRQQASARPRTRCRSRVPSLSRAGAALAACCALRVFW